MSGTRNDTKTADAGPLLAGIAAGCEEEAAAAGAEAAAYALDRAAKAEAQALALLAEAEATAVARAAAIRKEAEAALALERKKADLAVRDRLVHEIENRARAALERLAGEPDYRRYVSGWVAEAAIGLGVEEAVVNAGPAEWPLVDERMLREAEAAFQAATGRQVRLRRADRPSAGWRGVELLASGGQLAWDNRMTRRFARAAPVIRTIAYAAAYGDAGTEAGKAGRP